MSVFPRLGVKPGDTITLDLVTGQTGVTGEVVEVLEDQDGGAVQVAIREGSRPDPLWVRGDLISIWRLGEPVRQMRPVPGLQVPVGLPNGLHQPPGG